MIGFAEALGKALQINTKYDSYKEYENMYLFYIKDAPKTIGGDDAPAIVLKSSGEVTSHPKLFNEGYGDWFANILREGSIMDRMAEIRPVSPTHPVRYYFEHKFIPNEIYKSGIRFMNVIVEEDNILNKIFHDMLKEEGVEDPYPEVAVKVIPYKIESVLLAIIELPKPEEEPLCYEVYALFDLDRREGAYYCLEKGGYVDDQPFLCGWSKEGTHLNYGNCTFDKDELIGDILRLFLNPEGEDTRKLNAAYTPKKDQLEVD